MSDVSKALRIVISTQGDTKGAKDVEQALKGDTEAAHEFVSAIKAGVGIGIGEKLLESLHEIPHAFQEIMREGIEFQRFMENSAIAIAGAFRSSQPEKYSMFSAAREDAEKALDLLQKKANQLGLDFESMVETYTVNQPTLVHAGLKAMQDQIDTITLLTQVASAKGVSGFQAQRDIIDILNGMGSRTILGKELEANGIDDGAIERAKEMGNLAQLLQEKLGAFGEASAAASHTFQAEMQRSKNELQQLAGELAKPLFDDLKEGLRALNEELAKPEVAQALRSLGYDVAFVVDQGLKLTEWAVRNADSLILLAKGVTTLAIALAALKIKDAVMGMVSMVASEEQVASALNAETAALERNSAAQVANTASRSRNASAAATTTYNAAGLYTDYKAYRAQGLSPADATSLAKEGASSSKSLIDAQAALGKLRREAEESTGVFGRFAEKINFKPTAFGGLEGFLSRAVSGAFMVALVKEGADAVQNHFQRGLDDQKASDSATLRKQSGFMKSADAAKTQEERDALIKDIEDYLNNGGGKLEVALRQLIDHLRAKDLPTAKDVEDAARYDSFYKGQQADDTKLNDALYEDQKARTYKGLSDPEKVKSLQADIQAQQSVKESGPDSGYSDEDRAAATERLIDLTKQLRDLQESMAKKAEEDAAKKAKQDEEDAKKKAEEAKKANLDDLNGQKAQIDAEGKLRLAQLEQLHLKEADYLAKRKAIEDDIAKKRLEVENQIGDLQEENDLYREARQTAYEAARIERQNQYDDQVKKAQDENTTKPGDLVKGTNHRRGLFSSDQLDRDVTTNSSGLDNWHDLQATGPLIPPAASVPPVATPGDSAGASGKGGESGGTSEVSNSVKGLSDGLTSLFKQLSQEITKAAQQIPQTGQPAIQAIQAVQAAQKELEQEFQALKADT